MDRSFWAGKFAGDAGRGGGRKDGGRGCEAATPPPPPFSGSPARPGRGGPAFQLRSAIGNPLDRWETNRVVYSMMILKRP